MSRDTRSARPRKASLLQARYVSNPRSRSIFDYTSIRAEVNKARFRDLRRERRWWVEKVVMVRIDWRRMGWVWWRWKAVVVGGRAMKGK